jgi:digeranylgeranylglycerophospholipid reductase
MMKTRYDLIVVGAGPGGLVAAKTAAENGLSVALLERKDCIHNVLRMCGQMIVSLSGKYMSEHVIHNKKAGLLCFPHNGINIKYDGPTKDFYSWQVYSPNEEKIVFGDYNTNIAKGKAGRSSAVYDKSWLLQGLLDECIGLGVDVFTGVNVVGIVKKDETVTIQTANGNQYKGVFVVAADGRQSRIARLMGLNKRRSLYCSITSVGYEMTNLNLDEPYALHQPLIQSGNPPMMGFILPRAWDHKGEDVWLAFISNVNPSADHEALFDHFTTKGRYSKWFKGAQKIKRVGCAGNMYSPIIHPCKDNVLFVGDAGWCQEAEMTGAVMCGVNAARAIVEAMMEKKYNDEGVKAYGDWWQHYHIEKLDHRVFLRNLYMPILCTDEEIDYIFMTITDVLPTVLDPYEVPECMGEAMLDIIPMIKKEKPELLNKLSSFSTLSPEIVLAKTIRAGFHCDFSI